MVYAAVYGGGDSAGAGVYFILRDGNISKRVAGGAF